MNCPRCHKPKEQKDFYWRGLWKAYPECRTCVKEIRDLKKALPTTPKGVFDFGAKNWIKLIIG